MNGAKEDGLVTWRRNVKYTTRTLRAKMNSLFIFTFSCNLQR